MKQTDVEKMLIEIVSDLQKSSGREVVKVTPKTRPFVDMPDFDSLNGVEATVDILDKLGLDLSFNNVFAENDKALSISEAAARLMRSMVVEEL